MKAKIPQLREAVPGRFSDHHGLLVGELLAHIDYLAGTEARLDSRVDELIDPFVAARDLLMTIPGIGKRNAEIMIAEIGVDMGCFPTAAHLASWAGVCPGTTNRPASTAPARPARADPWLESALIEAGWRASRIKGCSMQVRFWRIAKRRGSEEAAIAIAHHLLVVIWYVLSRTAIDYNELGPDYLARFDDPTRRQRQLVHQLEQLGLKSPSNPPRA